MVVSRAINKKFLLLGQFVLALSDLVSHLPILFTSPETSTCEVPSDVSRKLQLTLCTIMTL